VGIGTTEPVSILTVAGTIETTLGGIKFPTGNIQTDAAGASQWTASVVNDIYNNNIGNVGIGTTAPGAKLDVTAEAGDAICGTTINTGSSGLYGKFNGQNGIGYGVYGEKVGSGFGGYGVYGIANGGGTEYGVYGTAGGSPPSAGVYGSGTFHGVYGVSAQGAGPYAGVYGANSSGGWAGFFNGSTYVAGKLGVGTDIGFAPDYELTVNGTVDAQKGVRFPDGFTQTVAYTGGGGGISTTEADARYIMNTTEAQAGNINISGNGMFSGSVGIGTVSPGTSLEVNGQVKITGGAPGSGKVLTSDDTGLATWQTPASVTSVEFATLSGTASQLATARTIGGVPFDGSADITVASAEGGFTVSDSVNDFSFQNSNTTASDFTRGINNHISVTTSRGSAEGIYNDVHSYNDTATGITQNVDAHGSGTSTTAYGMINSVTGITQGSGAGYGVYNTVSHPYRSYGTINDITSGNMGMIGTKNNINGSTGPNTSNYGSWNIVKVNGGARTNYGVYCDVSNESDNKNYGIYALSDKNYFSGNVGIGTTEPTATLEVAGQVKIKDGSQGAGKVLTDSDGSGLASWQTAAGGGISTAEADTRYIKNGTGAQTADMNILGNGIFGGNVGIGITDTSAYKVKVNAEASSGPALGIWNYVIATTNGSGEGIRNEVYSHAAGGPPSPTTAYGINQIVDATAGGGNNTAYGMKNTVTASTMGGGSSTGVYNVITHPVDATGINNNVTVTGGGPAAKGTVNTVSGAAVCYGTSNTVTSNGGGPSFGYYANVSGGSENYGIYAAADKNYFSGKVGIGTSTPASILTVAGTIETTLGGVKFPGGGIQTVPYAGGGITSLGSQTGATQTFATGTTGTDFNITSESNTHTFNIPDASATARGLINTGDQTFTGNKTFSQAGQSNVTLKVEGPLNPNLELKSTSVTGETWKILGVGDDGTLQISISGGANAGNKVLITPVGTLEAKKGVKFPDNNTQTVAFQGTATDSTKVAKAGDQMSGNLDVNGKATIEAATGKISTIGNLKVVGSAEIGGSGNSATGANSIAMGASNASGDYSTAMGKGTVASGKNSTAMGDYTNASGGNSTAMGTSTIASEEDSTAMGYMTIAGGVASTAIGWQTLASGGVSTAMGMSTTAIGNYSTAMGQAITAKGENSFGIGLNDTVSTIESTNTMAIMGGNVGIGTTEPKAVLHVVGSAEIDGNLKVTGTIEGDSPVKIAGGLNVVTGGLTANQDITIEAASLWVRASSEGFSRIYLDNNTAGGEKAYIGWGGTTKKVFFGKTLNPTVDNDLFTIDLYTNNVNVTHGKLTVDGTVEVGKRLNVTGKISGESLVSTNNLTLLNGGIYFNDSTYQSSAGVEQTGGSMTGKLTIDKADLQINAPIAGFSRVYFQDFTGEDAYIGWGGGLDKIFFGKTLTPAAENDIMILNLNTKQVNIPGLNTGAQHYAYVDSSGNLLSGPAVGSDIRLKKNITSISDQLDVLASLKKLRGVYFNWKTPVKEADGLGDKREIGMIAQEVEPVLPELVSTGSDGYKSLDYPKLTSYLLEVCKAQQKEIEEQKNQNDLQQKDIETLKEEIRLLKGQ
jgi:hypothetical protein